MDYPLAATSIEGISLKYYTVTKRTAQINAFMTAELCDQIADATFVAFAVDESTDVRDSP